VYSGETVPWRYKKQRRLVGIELNPGPPDQYASIIRTPPPPSIESIKSTLNVLDWLRAVTVEHQCLYPEEYASVLQTHFVLMQIADVMEKCPPSQVTAAQVMKKME
jgi:hypothetical protein